MSKIQNEDIKSLSQLTGAGGSASQLINDTKIYVTSLSKQLSQAIGDGDLSGGGGGGSSDYINLMALSSSWQPTKTDNTNAESTVGDWVAFADAATSTPTGDLTGGTPNSTIARTTTVGEVLNGAGGFEVTINSGASRQGEGVSCDAYIPLGYRGKNLQLSMVYTTSGTIATNDIQVAIYDVTNSALITVVPFKKLNAASGQVLTYFPVQSSTQQIRVGLYIGRSTTGALSIYFDDVVLQLDRKHGDSIYSEVTVTHGNGNGSTNTTVRRFSTTSLNQGTAITYADSATLGGSFTINESGWYTISYSDNGSGSGDIGVTINGSALTTGVSSITYAQGKRTNSSFSSNTASCSWSGWLAHGDIIRAQFGGTMTNGANQTIMTVSKTI